ncbi:MAG: hypothetical protein AMJ62_07705 [Myxococcales bacterium SG8_38]|nr:MAG: hypothetical protein AMJ62_07705 [Myxococcales bacterium SG8_38]
MKRAAFAISIVVVVGMSASSTSAQYDDPLETGYPHIELGFDVGVMLWNGVDRDVVRPGGTVDFRFGWDYEWWVPMFALGFRGSGVDLGTYRETLTNFFFALGMRFVAPNRSRVAPFADGWFDFNWWHLNETQLVCDDWYCAGTASYRFTPGFHGRIGMQIRVARYADLEVSFGAGYSFQGQFFLKNESWLEPAVGFTYSFPAGYEDRTSIHGY